MKRVFPAMMAMISFVLFGCGSSSPPPPVSSTLIDGGSAPDSGTRGEGAGGEGTGGEGLLEGSGDAGGGLTPDAGPDAGPNGGPDGGADGAPDGSPEASDAPEAGLPPADAGSDEGPDEPADPVVDPDEPDEPSAPGGPSAEAGVPASLSAILDEIPGWGAGTRGGRDGNIYTVTGLHFSGPGSLRDALESPEPLWIVFAPGVNGILVMDAAIRVRSFKTIDGRGHDITLRAAGTWSGGLHVGVADEPGVEHVAILNLTFDGQWENYTDDAEGEDGINIRNDSHHIWVHQCTFTNWADGAIDAKADAGFDIPSYITISNNVFTKTHQPLAVAIDRLTFARNHCIDVTKRCIQLNYGARGHMVNNVIENWRSASIVASKDGAQLLVDHNLFKPGPDCDAVGARLRSDTDELGRWQNENNHWRLSWGWVAFKEATSVNSGMFSDTRAAYFPVQCGFFDVACWDALFAEVVAQAGARP